MCKTIKCPLIRFLYTKKKKKKNYINNYKYNK